MNEIIPIDAIERMAQIITQAKFYGYESVEQAASLMLIAQAEGRHPASAAKEYHIIKGRPALKADAMLARYQNAGGKIQWGERTDNKVSAKFSHPSSGDVDIEWTLDYAKRAGLCNGDNWRKYPRQMLSARVISEGVRASFPSVVCGIYTPEEVEGFDESPRPAPKISKPKFVEKTADAKIVEPEPEAAPEEVPPQVENTEPADPLADLRDRLYQTMEVHCVDQKDVLGFLAAKMKPEQYGNATRIADLPEKVLKRLIEKIDLVVAYAEEN